MLMSVWFGRFLGLSFVNVPEKDPMDLVGWINDLYFLELLIKLTRSIHRKVDLQEKS